MLVEVRVNCEQNSLVFLVRPRHGGICHTTDSNGPATASIAGSIWTTSDSRTSIRSRGAPALSQQGVWWESDDPACSEQLKVGQALEQRIRLDDQMDRD